MSDDHKGATAPERLFGIGLRDGTYNTPAAYPGLHGLECTGSSPTLHEGVTCPVHEGIDAGTAYAFARREANAMRTQAFRLRSPIFAAYTEAMAEAGSPTGAASGETTYGCPSEFDWRYPYGTPLDSYRVRAPSCGACGEKADPSDWNPETGCHRTCEWPVHDA